LLHIIGLVYQKSSAVLVAYWYGTGL